METMLCDTLMFVSCKRNGAYCVLVARMKGVAHLLRVVANSLRS